MRETSLDELARKWRAAQAGAGPVPALYVDPQGRIGEASPDEGRRDATITNLTPETFAGDPGEAGEAGVR